MLTNERLKEIAESYPRLGLTETELKSIAAKLSQLRELRDMGDDGVERLTNEILYQLRTSDITIARGQQLREARDEIERLKILYENDRNVIDRLSKEKIRLVQLFRFWVIEYSRLSPGEAIRLGEYIDDIQEIRELLEE